MNKLKEYLSEKISFHFTEIQKIIDIEEKGRVDINLFMLRKIHHNCHHELVEVNKKFEKDIKELKEEFHKKFTVYDCTGDCMYCQLLNKLVEE